MHYEIWVKLYFDKLLYKRILIFFWDAYKSKLIKRCTIMWHFRLLFMPLISLMYVRHMQVLRPSHKFLCNYVNNNICHQSLALSTFKVVRTSQIAQYVSSRRQYVSGQNFSVRSTLFRKLGCKTYWVYINIFCYWNIKRY